MVCVVFKFRETRLVSAAIVAFLGKIRRVPRGSGRSYRFLRGDFDASARVQRGASREQGGNASSEAKPSEVNCTRTARRKRREYYI